MPYNNVPNRPQVLSAQIRYVSSLGAALATKDEQPYTRDTLEFEVFGLRLINRAQATKISELEERIRELEGRLT